MNRSLVQASLAVVTATVILTLASTQPVRAETPAAAEMPADVCGQHEQQPDRRGTAIPEIAIDRWSSNATRPARLLDTCRKGRDALGGCTPEGSD